MLRRRCFWKIITLVPQASYASEAIGLSRAKWLWRKSCIKENGILLNYCTEVFIGRDGFRQRGALRHLSFCGPAQVWPIWPFVWKAWKCVPRICSAPSKIYLLLCRPWFYDCLRSGSQKLRPATPFHPAKRFRQ